MKKEQLKEIARTLAAKWHWVLLPTKFYGWELNLTPVGERQRLKPQNQYTYPMPHLIRKTTKQIYSELLNCNKTSGEDGVLKYIKNSIS